MQMYLHETMCTINIIIYKTFSDVYNILYLLVLIIICAFQRLNEIIILYRYHYKSYFYFLMINGYWLYYYRSRKFV